MELKTHLPTGRHLGGLVYHQEDGKIKEKKASWKDNQGMGPMRTEALRWFLCSDSTVNCAPLDKGRVVCQ